MIISILHANNPLKTVGGDFSHLKKKYQTSSSFTATSYSQRTCIQILNNKFCCKNYNDFTIHNQILKSTKILELLQWTKKNPHFIICSTTKIL